MPTATISRAPKAAVGVAALLVAGLALAGCGSGGSGSGGKTSSDASLTPAPSASDTPSGGPSSSSLPPGAESKPLTCGSFQMKGNEESLIRIKGTAPCPSLMTIIAAYNKAPKSTGGVATVKGWKCRTASPAENHKHGYITICTKGPDEFVTKLHH